MAVFRYACWVGTDRRWTDEAVLRESERWVHIPQDGMCSEDDRRLLVHLPKRWGTSRVWRSWAADEGQASYLIEETIGEVWPLVWACSCCIQATAWRRRSWTSALRGTDFKRP